MKNIKPLRFNKKNVLEEFRKKRIKVNDTNGLLLCEFNRVKLGSEYEGYLIYNRIVVVLHRYRIVGFMFRFLEFDYSSYWELDRPFHPNLKVTKGKTPSVYNLHQFVIDLKDTVRKYDSQNCLRTIPEIISDFQDVRRLWATSRFLIKDRTTLSKTIFTEKN